MLVLHGELRAMAVEALFSSGNFIWFLGFITAAAVARLSFPWRKQHLGDLKSLEQPLLEHQEAESHSGPSSSGEDHHQDDDRRPSFSPLILGLDEGLEPAAEERSGARGHSGSGGDDRRWQNTLLRAADGGADSRYRRWKQRKFLVNTQCDGDTQWPSRWDAEVESWRRRAPMTVRLPGDEVVRLWGDETKLIGGLLLVAGTQSGLGGAAPVNGVSVVSLWDARDMRRPVASLVAPSQPQPGDLRMLRH